MIQIKLFLYILSLLYTGRHLLIFILKLFQEEPEVIKITNVNIILLHISIAYIITYNLI